MNGLPSSGEMGFPIATSHPSDKVVFGGTTAPVFATAGKALSSFSTTVFGPVEAGASTGTKNLQVVGNCPKCGAPIYGLAEVSGPGHAERAFAVHKCRCRYAKQDKPETTPFSPAQAVIALMLFAIFFLGLIAAHHWW